MRNFARRLISAERRASDSADTGGHAAFRACDKLRDSLSALVGTRGFRTLLSRALTLATAEVPWLGKIEIGPGGALVIPDALEMETRRSEAAKGGVALVTHLLVLLATFIGEALTLRLVRQIWPKTAPNDRNKEAKNEN